MMNADDPRVAAVIKAAAGYHPVGFICNWAMLSVLVAAVGIALFKDKILAAVILVFVAMVVRFFVMYSLKVYLVRKYR